MAESAKMATMISSTEVLGERLLKEIAAEEGSLEDVSPVQASIPQYFSLSGHMKVTWPLLTLK